MKNAKRPGASLVAVLALLGMAALAFAATFLLFEWSHLSTLAARRQFLARTELASLAARGRAWLRAGGGDITPAVTRFTDALVFHHTEEDGVVLNIYNLTYPLARFSGWTGAEAREERPFPPREGAFLLRAIKPSAGMMLEAVVSGDTLLMWREVWLDE